MKALEPGVAEMVVVPFSPDLCSRQVAERQEQALCLR
jgi:hypothetical protein